MTERPPMGIMPEYIWKEKRLQELSLVIMRHVEGGYSILPEWIDEYNRLRKVIYGATN